jgi:hypothetical protein
MTHFMTTQITDLLVFLFLWRSCPDRTMASSFEVPLNLPEESVSIVSDYGLDDRAIGVRSLEG